VFNIDTCVYMDVQTLSYHQYEMAVSVYLHIPAVFFPIISLALTLNMSLIVPQKHKALLQLRTLVNIPAELYKSTHL